MAFRLSHRVPGKSCCLIGSVLLLLAGGPAVIALAAQQETDALAPGDDQAPDPNDELAAQQMIANIRALVVPQQKERAREMIKMYPNTRVAALAQMLLAELKLYEAAAARERQAVELQTHVVREYWKARYPDGLGHRVAPMQITNLSGEPVLYQVRGPGMGWSTPHSIRAGGTHDFKYPLQFRRMTQGASYEYVLHVGRQYYFRKPSDGGAPYLTEASEPVR